MDVTVTISAGTAQRAVRSIGVGGVIGKDTSPGFLSSFDNPFLLQRDSYANSQYYTVLASNSLLKASIDNFFAQPGSQSLWCYRFGTGAGGSVTDEPSFTEADGTVTRFASQQSPVSAITTVKIDYKDGNGLQTIDPADWTANLDGTMYDGSISFTGSWTYDGIVRTTAPVGSVVYLSYTWDELATAFKSLRELDIQLLWMAYDPTLMTAAYTYTGVSLLRDYKYGYMEAKRCDAMAKYRHFIGMLPRNKTPSDLDTGYGDPVTPRYFRLWSGSQMSDMHMILVGHRSEDDVAAALAGVISGLEPQKGIDKQAISVAMDSKFEATAVYNFEQASMVCLDRPWEAVYSLRMHRGFTTDLTSDALKWIDTVRVIDDLRFSLIVDLWAALATNAILMNANGMVLTRAFIEATCLGKKLLGRIDGLRNIVIPFEELALKKTRTTAEEILYQQWKNARAIRRVKIEVEYSGNAVTIELNAGVV